MTLSRFWSTGDDKDDNKVNGFDTVVENSITNVQFQVYTNLVRIQEIDQCVYNNRYVEWSSMEPIDGFEREPEPIYDFKGKRINTREILLKKKLENERNELIKAVLNKLPQYKVPNNYNPQVKIVEKLFLNVHEHPDINFMGLLLGPRGNTLKKLQQESGAKIGIRGKGSVKGGRSNNNSGGNSGNTGSGSNNLDEDLHCLIIADSQSKVDLAKKLCLEVIDEVISAPEGQNEHKRNQLRELALLNGTFRESVVICSNCGENGHRKYQCPNSQLANQFKCLKCGGIGHLEKDCINVSNHDASANNEMDDEFSEFMKELGENTTTPKTESVNVLKRPLENEYERTSDNSNYNNNNYHNKRHYKSYEQNGYDNNNNNYSYHDYNSGGYRSNYNHGNNGNYYGYGYKNQQSYNRGYNSHNNSNQQMSYGVSKSPFSNAPPYNNSASHNFKDSGNKSGSNNSVGYAHNPGYSHNSGYSNEYKTNVNKTSNKLPPPPPPPPSQKLPPMSSIPLRKNNLPPPPPPPPKR